MINMRLVRNDSTLLAINWLYSLIGLGVLLLVVSYQFAIPTKLKCEKYFYRVAYLNFGYLSRCFFVNEKKEEDGHFDKQNNGNSVMVLHFSIPSQMKRYDKEHALDGYYDSTPTNAPVVNEAILVVLG
jgi:hypothetical protein